MRERRFAVHSLHPLFCLLIIALTIVACAAPIVQITRPVDKEIVSGTADIQVSYAADGASPIVRLEVLIDGQLVKDFLLKQPTLQGHQAFQWDFRLATPSVHSISAQALDASGAIGATAIKVVVQRRAEQATAAQGQDRTPPTVEILFPEEGQVYSGDLNVKAEASDNVGVKTVVFYLDGKFKSMTINSSATLDATTVSTRIDTRRLSDGSHTVSVGAWDTSDNEGQSAPRSFVVSNLQATKPSTGEDRTAKQAPIVPLVPPMMAPPVAAKSAPGVQVATIQGMANAGDARLPALPPMAGDWSAKTGAPTGTTPGGAARVPVVSGPFLQSGPTAADVIAATEPFTGLSSAKSGAPTDAAPTRVAVVPGRLAPPPSGPTFALSPTAAGSAAVMDPARVAAAPKGSQPDQSGLPKPLPAPASTTPQTPKAPARLDGMIASVPPYLESAAAAGRAPESPAPSPLAGLAGSLAASPRQLHPVMVAKLSSAESALGQPPAGSESLPKTGAITRERPVVLATPQPAAATAPGASGLRENRVAALPPRKLEDEPGSKMGRPTATLDVSSMASFKDVKVVFNGHLLPLRTAPLVLDGISIAPLREIFEHTDGVLYWYHVEKRVKAVNGKTQIELRIGDKTAKVNGADEELVLAPFIKNGRTMVPLEFIAQTLDVTVSFNPTTGELVISSNKF